MTMGAAAVSSQVVELSPGERCAESFDMAAREALKAWRTTALLSRVRHERVDSLRQSFGSGDACSISGFLTEVAGTPFDGYAILAGADGGSLMKLARITMKSLCKDLFPAPDDDAILDSLATIYARTRQWIVAGRFSNCSEDLVRFAELMGDDPSARLGLMAPYSPAIAITQFITRASKAKYPFVAESI